MYRWIDKEIDIALRPFCNAKILLFLTFVVILRIPAIASVLLLGYNTINRRSEEFSVRVYV